MDWRSLENLFCNEFLFYPGMFSIWTMKSWIVFYGPQFLKSSSLQWLSMQTSVSVMSFPSGKVFAYIWARIWISVDGVMGWRWRRESQRLEASATDSESLVSIWKFLSGIIFPQRYRKGLWTFLTPTFNLSVFLYSHL